MRLFPIITAITVIAVLYLLVFERDQLLSFSGAGAPADSETISAEAEVTAENANDGARAVPVVALRSEATSIDGAVILRGRTEAARQVEDQMYEARVAAGELAPNEHKRTHDEQPIQFVNRLYFGTYQLPVASTLSGL